MIGTKAGTGLEVTNCGGGDRGLRRIGGDDFPGGKSFAIDVLVT